MSIMKHIIKGFATLTTIFLIVFGTTIPSHAEELYVKGMDGTILYSGSAEECNTYTDYIRKKYMNMGSGSYADGSLSELSYAYGNDSIKFDFDTKKMTWIDGSKYKITNTDYANKNKSGYYVFTDDAVKLFCPEFAQSHSLVPDGAPANFSTVLEKARNYNDKRLGITRDSVAATGATTSSVIESYDTFDATDYANRYPDVKNALGTDKQALWNHYQTYGKKEGRTANFTAASSSASASQNESYATFNATDYANRYPDVKNALGTDKQALWNHYQTYGKAEGRTAVFQ
jgi:hypothetical protein